MPSRRRGAAARAAAGVTGHRTHPPGAGEERGRYRRLADEDPATGQADLPAVRMPAELERVSTSGRLFRHLGTVREKNTTFPGRNVLHGCLKVMGAEIVRIVDAANPDPLSIAFQGDGLIEQHANAALLKDRNLGQQVMVSQDRKGASAQLRNQTQREIHGGLPRSANLVVKVTGDDRLVEREPLQPGAYHVNERRLKIRVEIGNLQQPKPVECRRQSGKHHGILHDTNGKKLPPGSRPLPEQAKTTVDEPTHQSHPVRGKFSALQGVLSSEPFGQPIRPEAGGGIGGRVDHVATKPASESVRKGFPWAGKRWQTARLAPVRIRPP